MGEGEKNQANMKQTNEKPHQTGGLEVVTPLTLLALEALLELPPRLLHCL